MEFSVKGGTVRTINLDSTDDMSLVSELEQARSHNNISLALLVTQNFLEMSHPSINYVYDLLEFAARGIPFPMQFSVEGKVGKTITQSFNLVCKEATIMQPQDTSKSIGNGDRVLVVRLATPNARLVQGSLGKFIEAE
jgi:hypothetical protein